MEDTYRRETIAVETAVAIAQYTISNFPGYEAKHITTQADECLTECGSRHGALSHRKQTGLHVWNPTAMWAGGLENPIFWKITMLASRVRSF